MISIRKIIRRGLCTISADGEPGSACVAADPVVNALIITPDTAILNGEWVLDTQGFEWGTIVATGPSTENFETGKNVRVTVPFFGDFIGKISGVSMADEPEGPSSQVQLTIKVIIT